MPIKVTCSNCGGVLHAPDDSGGKRGRCPTCGNVLPIPAESPKLPPAAAEVAPKTGGRSPSFGDFNLGPQVSPPTAPNPTRAAPAAGSPLSFAEDSPSNRSSVPSLAEPTMGPRRGKPLPPALPPEDARRPNDPFARKVSGKPELDNNEGTVRNWKRVRGGLWWCQASVPFFFLPILTLNGLKLYEQFVGPVPVKDPGYSGQEWLSSQQEIDIVAVMAPFALGVFLLMIGRFGVAKAPRKAQARGLTLLSALATLTAICGGIAVIYPIVTLLAIGVKDIPVVSRARGVAEWQLLFASDDSGMMQRIGLLIGATAFVVAEVWFTSALGRLGTALNSSRLAGRATRFLLVLGLIFGGLVAVGALTPAYNFSSMPREASSEVNNLFQVQWNRLAEPLLDKLGAQRSAVRPGVFLLGGLMIAMMYWRMIGAGRGAVRDWLDQNDRL